MSDLQKATMALNAALPLLDKASIHLINNIPLDQWIKAEAAIQTLKSLQKDLLTPAKK